MPWADFAATSTPFPSPLAAGEVGWESPLCPEPPPDDADEDDGAEEESVGPAELVDTAGDGARLTLPGPVAGTESIGGITLWLAVDGGWLADGSGVPVGLACVGLLVGVVEGEAGADEPGLDAGGLAADVVGAGVLGCDGEAGCDSLPGGWPEFLPGGTLCCGSDDVGVGRLGMVTGPEPGPPGSVDSVHEGSPVGSATVDDALVVNGGGSSVGRQLGISVAEDAEDAEVSVGGPSGGSLESDGSGVVDAVGTAVGSGQ